MLKKAGQCSHDEVQRTAMYMLMESHCLYMCEILLAHIRPEGTAHEYH